MSAPDDDGDAASDRSGSGDRPLRIAAVAELTGVPEPTLRAWERRYGVPSPERTAAGYRLYRAAEVDEVRRMRQLCDQGMAAAEAASLLRAIRAEQGRTPPPVEDPFAKMVDEIVDRVERFDDEGLERAMRQLLMLGTSLTVLDRVVAPALGIIGDRWHGGALGVAHEHLASQRLGGLLRDLIRLAPGNESPDRMVLACFADDEHELGLLGVGIRVAEMGLRPVFLGARTPPTALRSAVAATAPELVGLSVTVAPPRARARELLEEYAAACGRTPWLVGGAAASSLADLIRKFGGEVAPDDPRLLAQALRGALGRRPSRRKRRLT